MSFVAYSSTTVSDISSNLILSVDTWYYLSTSNKTLVGGTWQTNPPTWEEHKYYWQKTITTYNNGTTTETKPVCITGGTGQPGTGIEQIVEEYAISDSKTVAPKTGWQGGTAPQWEYGKYIWSRTKIVYKNPTSVVYTTPVCDTAWEAVNGLEVGGRNLILNSSFKNRKNHGIYTFNGDEVTFSTNTPLNNNNSSVENFRIAFSMSDYFLKNIRGKTITISMDYYVEKPIVYGTTDPFIGIEIGLQRNSNTGGSTQHFSWYGGKTFPTNVTGKWIRYSKNVTVSDHDVTSYGVYLYMMDASGTVKFRHPKIEFGNKATDWSTAPEDTEEQIHVLTDSLAGVSSIVNKLDKTITDKVWQDDFTTTINNYDATVAESIRSRVTETEKSIKGITSTVKDMETTVSKKADGSTVETLTTRLTKAEQDASGFKTTVQDYFTTTDKTLNGIQSWKTEVNQKISKDGILSTVGDYYATQDELKNLNVGGNNLVNKDDVQALNNTSLKVNDYTFNISGQVTSSNFDGVFIPDTIFQKDEFYVFSYKFTVKSGSVTKIGGHQAAFKIVKAVVDGIEYKTEYDAGYPLDNKKTEHTVAVYLKYHGVGSDQKLYIQPNRQGGSIGTWNIVLTELQIEKGNTKTAWSPSYQDMMNDIQTGSRNFLRNGNFAETTTSPGNTNKHHNLYPLGWGGYNGGIDNPTTSWHAHIDNTTFGFNVVEFNESDGNRSWKGIAANSADFIFIKKVDQEYRLSVDIYTTGLGTHLTGGFYYYKKGESTQHFHSGQFAINPQVTNKWVRMSAPVPLKDDIDFSKGFYFYIYGYGFASNAILYIKDVALTTGNKTADWSPAIEETEMRIAKVETIANQTKDKFTWLVKSGTSATNFELTDRTATLVANYINLKGLVTFAGLNSDTQGKISSAKSTADTVASTVNANKENWDKGYNWTNSNGGNMSKMLDMVKTWTDGALTTTTTINGGYIRTNTINASHLTLGDFTNLVDVNESLPQSAVPDNTHPFGSHAKPICKNGYWYKESAASEYLALSSYKPNSFADGDELYYEFTAHSELAGNYFIALWFYNGASKEFQTMKRGNIESVTTSDKTFSGIIKLEDAKKYDFFAIGIGDNNNTHAQIYAKNISVRKKTNASLIVDGSIVGKHIAANTIDASKIQIGNLNNICVVNPDTYNPYGLAVIESHGQKYFRLGANTDSSTPRYISLPLRRNISSNTYYPVGDCWKFRAYGYQTVTGVAYTFCIRVLYTDGSNTNLGTCRLDPPAYNPGYFEGICQITTKPIAGKPISHFEIFIETGHKKSHYLYLRDITIYSMTNATLLEDGSVTTDKLTTSNIVGTNGWINLRSGTFNYGNGKFVWNGSTLTVNGSGSFSGTITSSAGTIGGWSINGSSIYHGSSDYNASTGMYFGTSGLRLGSAFKVNSNGYATINGGTFTGTINAETGKISGWRLLSSRLVSLDVDVQNETDFTNKGTKAVYLAKYNYNGQGSISAIGVQTRTSTSNSWVNRIDIRYDGSMVFKNQNDVIVTKFENGNWSEISTVSCNDIIIKQNAKSYKLSHRMLVCDDTANVLGVGMTTSGDRFIPMKDKKADYAHGKIAIGSNQNRFSEIWSVKALNTTSDRNLKTNMSPFDIRYEKFFMDLNTCTFMYKNFSYDDSHDRLHWGIDAQQAEQALAKNNITINEAGFLCIDNLEHPNAAGQMKEYSVRYSELIGLNIHMTQKNYKYIQKLEQRNQELEKRIALLEARLK